MTWSAISAPLAGIRHVESHRRADAPTVDTFIRTGDTPPDARQRMRRNPPDILITTPESLYLMLTSAAREILQSVRWVIVDEVHAVAGSKRAHLALSLERLEEVTDVSPQRIGLSATQRPLEAIRRYLGGGTIGDDGIWEPRPVTLIDVPHDRDLDIQIVVPVEDMASRESPTPRSGSAVDPLDLACGLSPASGADPDPPQHHRVRKFPTVGGAHLLGDQQSGRRGGGQGASWIGGASRDSSRRKR